MFLIERMLAEGGTVGDVAAALGIPRATFDRKAASDPEMAAAIKRGRDAHHLKRAENILKVAAFLRGDTDAAF